MQIHTKESINIIFSQWVDDYSEKLLNRAYYLLSDREQARDMVQEVFFSAYSKIESFESRSSPYTWLCSIMSNKVADTYRKRYKHGSTINFDTMFTKHGEWHNENLLNPWESLESEHALDNEEFLEIFDGCIEKLPERWGVVIKSSYLNSEASSYICDSLGISLDNYWKILQRSRLQLRECIDINWFKFDR